MTSYIFLVFVFLYFAFGEFFSKNNSILMLIIFLIDDPPANARAITVAT